MALKIQFILTSYILAHPIICQANSRLSKAVELESVEQFKDLDAIVGEYGECGIHLASRSKKMVYDPVTSVPVTIGTQVVTKRKKEAMINVTNPIPPRKFFCIAIFILFPKRAFSNLMLNVMSSAPIFYINVIHGRCSWCPGRIKAWDYTERVILPKQLAFFRFNLRKTRTGLTRHRFEQGFFETPTIEFNRRFFDFMDLENCFMRRNIRCEKEMELKFREYSNGKVVANVLTGKLSDRYKHEYVFTNATLLVKLGFIQVSDVIGQRLRNPFLYQGYSLSWDTIRRLFMLDPFHFWTRHKFPKTDLDIKRLLISMMSVDHVASTIVADGYISGVQRLEQLRYHVQKTKAAYQKWKYASVIPTGTTHMNFVTCDGVGQPLSFYFYLEPYDLWIWTGILALTFLIFPAMVLSFFQLTVKSKPRRNPINLTLDVLEFGITLLFEIPNVPKTFAKFPRLFRNSVVILGIWALMSVCLVNIYKGLLTTELTSTGQVHRTHVNVSDTMVNFVFYYDTTFSSYLDNAIRYEVLPKYGINLVPVDNLRGCLCFPDVSEIVPKVCSRSIIKCFDHQIRCSTSDTCEEVYSYLRSMGLSTTVPPGATLCDYDPLGGDEVFMHYRYTGIFDPMKSMPIRCHDIFAIDRDETYPLWKDKTLISFKKSFLIPLGGAKKKKFENIHHKLSNCYKTAYVDKERDLDAFIQFAEKKFNKNFRKGGERFFEEWEGLLIRNRVPKISIGAERLSKLVEHGIYQIWGKWFKIHERTPLNSLIKNELRVGGEKVKRLGLDTNILTIFYIYVIFTILAITIGVTQLLISKFSAMRAFTSDIFAKIF